MSDSISRYCPSCGARVKAPAEAFSKPAKCPKCGKVVEFLDHPNAAPSVTEIQRRVITKEPIDYVISVSLFTVPVLAVIGLGLMLFGDRDVLVLISAICLVFSLPLFAKYNRMRSQIAFLQYDSTEMENLAGARLRDLDDALVERKHMRLLLENLEKNSDEYKNLAEIRCLDLADAKKEVNSLQAFIQQRTTSHEIILQQKFTEYSKQLDSNYRVLKDTKTELQLLKSDFNTLVAKRIAEADAHLKTRLAEVDAHLKTELERASKLDDLAQQKLEEANDRNNTIDRLGRKLLGDSVKWITSKMSPNNFTLSSKRLRKVIGYCRKHEYTVDRSYEKELLDNLRVSFEDELRKQYAKEEQRRIKARIRVEQRAEKELEREMRRIEAEKKAIEKALKIALKQAKDEHSEEVDVLREKLREAEEKSQRAKSMAQQTKAGHVYVISNIGSLGEGVYKVGMTRRLEPLDRVKELGDASVPFPFDVHMMISCDDAPLLENTIHKTPRARRLNKVNNRREFFRVDLEEIHKLVVENHGEVEYLAEPEALQYRESMAMTDEEFTYVYERIESLMVDDEGGIFED